MVLPRRSGLALLLAWLLAGCAGNDSSAPPTSTSAFAPPGGRLASNYLLRTDQLPGYQRAPGSTVSAEALAADYGDSGLVQRLTGEGYQTGARVRFSSSRAPAATPFQQVISEALMFDAAAGATRFFPEEKVRRSQPPTGGTASPLGGQPRQGVDDLAVVQASVPAQAAGAQPQQAFLALVRRGRVVAELLASGDAGSATIDRFTPLIVDVEGLLATSPDA
ncbi:MAG: hypothetical protein E6J14_03185 [Chloroflexi bacterium]|nr:MAG: hypothetical protein E6J14_03185 [Chloroflexota bacterium]